MVNINNNIINELNILSKKAENKINSLNYLIICSMIGPGFLTLPNILKDNGIILGSFIILISGIGSLIGSIILIDCTSYYLNIKAYNEIVGISLGIVLLIE